MDNNSSDTFQTYETVGAGTYVCMQCGGENKKARITFKKKEMLPECEICGYTIWLKISL